jgi:hypothetical protein
MQVLNASTRARATFAGTRWMHLGDCFWQLKLYSVQGFESEYQRALQIGLSGDIFQMQNLHLNIFQVQNLHLNFFKRQVVVF